MKPPIFVPTVALLGLMLPFASAEVNFEKQVLPLIEKSCMDCHRAPYEEDGRTKDPKGGLRLDAAWAIEAGGESGAVIVAGDPEGSELLFRTMLPEEEDDFMPPKGEKWTDADKKVVSLWIKEGAKFGGWEGNLEGKPTEEAKEEVYISQTQVHYDKLAKDLKPAAKDAIGRVEEQGARVTPLATGNPLLEIDFLVNRDETTDEKVAVIGSVSENLAHLNLSRTPITDAALKSVGDLPRLTRLDLNNTAITDAGLKHLSGLKNLTYLNLYGTKISDEGIKDLGKIKSLENVYLWRTQVTDQGVKQLQKQLPDAKVNWK